MPEITPNTAPSLTTVDQLPDDIIKKHVRKETPVSAEDKAAAEAKTEAEFAELKKALPSVLWNSKPKEPTPEEKAAAEKKAADDKAAADKVAADKKAAEDAAKGIVATPDKKTKVTRQTDPATLIRQTGAEIARAIKDAVPAAAAAPKQESAKEDKAPSHFSEADKDVWELFKLLSDTEPDKYKGRHEEFASYVDKASARKKKYEKDNPGQPYNPDDDSEYLESIQPSYTVEDLTKARVRRETAREVESRLAKQREQYEERLRDVENRAVVPEVARQAAQVANQATDAFIKGISDEAIKTALSKGPDTLRESDPVAYDVLNAAAVDLQNHVSELHHIVSRSNYYNPNNPVHRSLAGFIEQQEGAIKQLPFDQQMFEGKQFATRAEYNAMPANQRPAHWVLTEHDVTNLLTKAISAKAAVALAQERKRIEAIAVKYGFKKEALAAGATHNPPGAAQVTPAPAVKKEQFPSGSAGAPSQPLGQPSGQPEAPVEKKLVSSLF